MFRRLRVLRSRPGRVQMLPQQTSVTYWMVGVVSRVVSGINDVTYFLHVSPIVLVCGVQGFVDMLFSCNLISHLDSFIIQHLTGFSDLLFGVVGGHIDNVYRLIPKSQICN